MKVVGVSGKVSNDREDLIDNVWELFENSDVLDYLNENNLTEDIVSVYCEFESDYMGEYTLLIGYEVEDDYDTPVGLNSIDIDLNHTTKVVKGELPDAIFEEWDNIYEDKSKERAHIADLDIYYPKEDLVEINVEYK
jgi:predicted transcriptional regulator YdeE